MDITSGLSKTCSCCQRHLPLHNFHVDRSRPDGYAYECAECRNRKSREKYERIPDHLKGPFGPPAARGREGDKLQARQRVNNAVKNGKMPSPNDLSCSDCGHIWSEGERRHEYDHYLGYSADNQYDVQPVCTTCHARRHNLKTHCLRGHEFTEDNTGHKANGTRFCRECRRGYDRGRRDAAYWREWRSVRTKVNGKWVKTQA